MKAASSSTPEPGPVGTWMSPSTTCRGEVGQLKKGMDATFAVVKGDPSLLPDALRDPVQVFVKGRPVPIR